MPDLQAIFDIVATHLRTQGEKAGYIDNRYDNFESDEKPNFICMYRLPMPDGRVLRCGAGCLIADEYYNEETMERVSVTQALVMRAICLSQGWSDMLNWYATPSFLQDTPTFQLIKKLQDVHDDNDVPLWETALRDAADLFGLTYTAP